MNNEFIRTTRIKGQKLSEWEILKTNTLYKAEYRHGEIELTKSYLYAAQQLQKSLREQLHIGSTTLLVDNPLTIPFIFLCRHTIELAIKAFLIKNNINYGNEHGLKKLIDIGKIKLPNKQICLINILDEPDDKSLWLRYDKDIKTKKEYISEPTLVNSNNIIQTVTELTNNILEQLK